jgi:hypothetical protein
MHFSGALHDAIESDAQALVWSREVDFDAAEVGTAAQFRRWMKKNSQFGNRKQDLGVGLLPWKLHVDSLQVNWLLNYIDATRGDWKLLLDFWFARGHEDRGTMFSRIKKGDLIKSSTKRVCALPRFWVDAVGALKQINLVKTHPRRWNEDDARAHPIWTSPLFRVHSARAKEWRNLGLHTVKDLLKHDGTSFTNEELLDYVRAKYHEASEGGFWLPNNKIWKEPAIIADWNRIVRAVPSDLLLAARGVLHPQEWRYSRESVRIMHNQGWDGGGLGSRGQGRADPVTVSRRPGFNMRGNPRDPEDPHVRFVRPRMNWNPTPAHAEAGAAQKKETMKGVVTSLGIRYGMPSGDLLREYTHTVKGHLEPNGVKIRAPKDAWRDVVQWDGKVVGIAESFFPHPKEWRIEGLDVDLDKIDVRVYTRFLAQRARVEPSCLSAWAERIDTLPNDIGERYNTRLLTPRDWGSHFKNVLHRALMVRSISTGEPCRCCSHAYENLQHFPTCDAAKKIFTDLYSLVTKHSHVDHVFRPPKLLRSYGLQWERFCLFALLPRYKLESSIVDLHSLLWKQFIAHLVRIELEGEKFDTTQVWAPAWARLEKKILALKFKVNEIKRRAESRGEKTPDLSKRSKNITPIATFNEEGDLKWNDELVKEIKAFTQRTKPRAAGGR